MTAQALHRYTAAAARAARAAGALLIRSLQRPRRVSTKGSASDLVTNVDRASEHLIRRLLYKATPTFGFLGEEHGTRRDQAACRWIVDPIDGTTNFVHSLPFFCISIALEAHGVLVVGVIYDPIRQELFSAARDQGAQLNGRRLRVSRTARLSKSLLSSGFPSAFRQRHTPYLDWFRALEARTHAVRRMGSTALSLAYVAAGRFDGFYETELKPWDIAGGIVLVREAGGQVTDFHGQTGTILRGRVVASNRRLHRPLLRAITRASSS